MPPVDGSEVMEIFSSLSDVVPFLSPARAIIQLIIAALEKVEDNTNQCSYLLHRCLGLYVHIHNGCCEGIINAGTYSAALLRFRASLEKIHLCMVEISRKTPLQRLFQRHEISDSVQNAHRDLNGCLELFHVEAATSLIFVVEEHEDARVRDQAQLNATLTELLKNDVDILTNLDLRTDQIMEAIRGLQNTLKRGFADSIQEKFAEDSLHLLREGHHIAVQPSYEWAISSLEIFVEGEVIGSGAFGTVHSGRWNGSRVAVKKLARGTPRQILIREIEIWRRMQHPHIASFFRACIDTHPPLMISELYQYGNVVQYISQFPECNRLRLCYQISLGMQFLHAQKVIHGDLKPANVLIDDSHRARITDFGLSRIKTSLTTQTSADTSKTVVRVPGTKAFMAPERLLRGKNNFKTDVYAWGMSAYQIFCDEAPFQYLPEEDLRSSIVDHGVRPERPEDIQIVRRGLTDEIWQLLERSWMQEAQQRPEFREISEITSESSSVELDRDGSYEFAGSNGSRPGAPDQIDFAEDRLLTPKSAVSSAGGSRNSIVQSGHSDFSPSSNRLSIPDPMTSFKFPADSSSSALSSKVSRSSLGRSEDSNQTLPGSDQSTGLLPTAAPSKAEVPDSGTTSTTSAQGTETSLSNPWPLSGNDNGGSSRSTVSDASQSQTRKDSPQELQPLRRSVVLDGSPKDSEESNRKRPWARRLRSAESKAKSSSSVTESSPSRSKRFNKSKELFKYKQPEISPNTFPYPRELKITMVGSGGCGKTSLLLRFSTKTFLNTYDPTIEQYYRADISIAGSRILLDLTDTAGQEEYAPVLDHALQTAELAIIAFSITSKPSLEDVWARFVPQFRRVNKSAPMIIVGLKLDLRRGDSWEVTKETGEAVARQYDAPYLECSALTGEGVREVFETATKVAIAAEKSRLEAIEQRSSNESPTSSGCIIS